MARRVSIRAIITAALLAALVACAAGAVTAQENQKVVQVDITGNKYISTATIRSVISLKPGDIYSKQATDKDNTAIMSLGTFSAVTVKKDNVPGGVKVTYEVTENPMIKSIKVVGNGPIPVQKVLDTMKTKVGTVINTTTIYQDVEAIQSLYGDAGYVAWITEDGITIDPKTGVLTVPILLNTVESVTITGNKKTKAYVFLREMKTKPGKIFNMNVLKQDEMRIYDLNILEEIKNPQLTPGDQVGEIKVSIPVVEKKTGQVSLGVGYSSSQQLVGTAQVSETNFRGTGKTINAMWEQGASTAVGGSASYDVGYMDPWFDSHHTSLSIDGYSRIVYRFSSDLFSGGNNFAGTNEPYNERHTGGDFELGRPINDQTRVYFGGRFEGINIDTTLMTDNVNGIYATPGSTADQKATALLEAQNIAALTNSGPVEVGTFRLVHNTRDFDMDPAAGGYEGVNLEYGYTNGSKYTIEGNPDTGPFSAIESPFTGGFEKASFDFRRYWSPQGPRHSPNDKRTVLAFRLLGGFAGGTLPFYEQFFVGGADSLRGYREDRFWGNKMMLASFEFRQPIAHGIVGVIFSDYGDAWGSNQGLIIEDLPQSLGFSGHLGVGVGMRVTTPIGELRLDYGIGSEGGRTEFSMGQAF